MLLSALHLRTRSVLRGPKGKLFLVISRVLDTTTRQVVGVVVEPLEGGKRANLPLRAFGPLNGTPTMLQGDHTVLGRFMRYSVMERRRKEFRAYVQNSLSIKRIPTDFGIAYLSEELFRALMVWNRGRPGRTFFRDHTNPHYPGNPRKWCVVCGTSVRMTQGDNFPVHSECRPRNRNSLSVRYCSYCGDGYTVAEMRSRFPAMSSLVRQLSCPDGEDFRSTAREIR